MHGPLKEKPKKGKNRREKLEVPRHNGKDSSTASKSRKDDSKKDASSENHIGRKKPNSPEDHHHQSSHSSDGPKRNHDSKSRHKPEKHYSPKSPKIDENQYETESAAESDVEDEFLPGIAGRNLGLNERVVVCMPHVVLLLNLISIFVYIYLENNKEVFQYFAVLSAKDAEIWVLTLFSLAIGSSVFPVCLIIWALSLNNWALLVSYRGLGRLLIAISLLCWVGWIGYFCKTTSDCYNKGLHTQQKLYLGELAWNTESVALNYVMQKHKTCDRETNPRWMNSMWYENLERLHSGYWLTAKDSTPFPEKYFLTLGFENLVTPHPVSCCSFGSTNILNPLLARRLLPDSFKTGLVRKCYSDDSGDDESTHSTIAPFTPDPGNFNTTILGDFEKFVIFTDHVALKALYYVPKRGTKKTWAEAERTCSETLFNQLGTNRPLTLPLGINTAELLFLKSLKLLPMTVLGLVRKEVIDPVSKEVIKVQYETYSDDVPQFTIDNETSLDLWEKDATKKVYYRAYKYGCMDMKRTSRTICKDEARHFVCTKYGKNERNKGYPLTDPNSRSHPLVNGYMFLTVGIKKKYEEARQYCKDKYFGADISVGFTYYELDATRHFARIKGRFRGLIFLGIKRNRNQHVFYSEAKNIPVNISFGFTWVSHQPDPREDYMYVCLNVEVTARAACPNRTYPFVCVDYYETPFDQTRGRIMTSNHETSAKNLRELPTDETAQTVCKQILLFFTPTAVFMSLILIALLSMEISVSKLMEKIEKAL